MKTKSHWKSRSTNKPSYFHVTEMHLLYVRQYHQFKSKAIFAVASSVQVLYLRQRCDGGNHAFTPTPAVPPSKLRNIYSHSADVE